MLATDFSAFLPVCGGNPSAYSKSLHDASLDRRSNQYCLETGHAANLTAVDVEGLIGIWMDVQGRLSRNEPCPSTVDALYVQGTTWYLVEFKRNEKKTLSAMKSKLMYKAYDSVLQLVEHGLRTVTQFRENDYYIVVAPKVRGMTDEQLSELFSDGEIEESDIFDEAINGVSSSVLLRPWSVPVPPVDAGLDHFNTVLYKQAYTLTPSQFNLYAQEHGWK